MSSKRNHSPKTKECTCSVCGMKAVSVAEKRHRRCGGFMDAPLRLKHDPVAVEKRGRWQ